MHSPKNNPTMTPQVVGNYYNVVANGASNTINQLKINVSDLNEENGLFEHPPLQVIDLRFVLHKFEHLLRIFFKAKLVGFD
jgi:hypothetical protein